MSEMIGLREADIRRILNNRIEELEAENADLKAKLAKAVELLEEIDGFPRKQIKATLAGLTGGKDE